MARTLLLVSLLALAACGGSRIHGDPDGIPVTFQIELDRDFVRAMQNRQGRVGVGAGIGVGSGGIGGGIGLGLSFSSTHVTLLGGAAPGEASLFRQRLHWGGNTFTVPLRPGRSLVLTADVSGARSGWEVVGRMTIDPDDPVIRLVLGEAGGRIE